ncbi:hypothetical protein NODU109028_06585 [Nocardioides dubius]|uniref:Superfamily IV 4 TMS phage holin n=1 Tax=Nocardioides dubius TaxID=317019 RepID=A0ABP4E7F1_9ACTN
MIRLVLRILIYFGSAALGILAASVLLDQVQVEPVGFLAVVVVYAVLQSVLTPFITKMAATRATAFLGGTGLVASFIALAIAVAWGDAVTIDGGLWVWVGATVIVWLVTALATLLLPLVLVKAGIEALRESKETGGRRRAPEVLG